VQKRLTGNLLSILLISLVPVIAFHQVSFFEYCMKWDMMNYFLPTRYFMSECFSNHIWPWWCPYINLGYPNYADPQSGLWYLPDVVIALTVGYNVYVAQAEFVLHLIVAGIGMFMLLRTCGTGKPAATVVAAVFPLCGFFIGHATHPTLVVSMAWMPYVFNYFLLALSQRTYYRFIQVAITLALCLTGGYIPFAIITVYALVFIFVYYLYNNYKEPGYVVHVFSGGLLSVVIFAALCLPYFYSVVQSLPYIERSAGLDIAKANVNSFSPQSFISLLFPFAASASSSFFDVDMTMRNVYAGLFLFPLLTLAIIYGRRKNNIILLSAGVFCMAAAMGKYLPVRELLYHTLPFMNMFRYPSIFRAFTLICFLLVAADGLSVLYRADKFINTKSVLIWGLLIEGVIVLAFTIAALRKGQFNMPGGEWVTDVTALNKNGQIYQHVALQGIVQALFIVTGILVSIVTKERMLAVAVSALWITDMFAATQMSLPGTVISTVRTADFVQAFKKLPVGFPNPGNTRIIQYNMYGGEVLDPVVFNGSILRKEPCADGFNPFCLKSTTEFLESQQAPQVLNNPLAFLWCSTDSQKLNFYNTEVIYNRDKEMAADSASVVSFKPGEIEIKTNTKRDAILTVLQAHYPGWKANIDGVNVPVLQTNAALMSVAVTQGIHNVVFNHEPRYVKLFAFTQWLVYLMGIGLVLAVKRKS
jgi:hypothetical protein